MEGYDESKQSIDEYLSTYKPRGNKEKEAYDTIMAGITGQAKFEKQNPIKEPKGQMKSAKQGIKPVEDAKPQKQPKMKSIPEAQDAVNDLIKENPDIKRELNTILSFMQDSAKNKSIETANEWFMKNKGEFVEMYSGDDKDRAKMQKAYVQLRQKLGLDWSL